MKTFVRILKITAILLCVMFMFSAVPWLRVQLREFPNSPEVNNAVLMVTVPLILALLYLIPYKSVLKSRFVTGTYITIIMSPLLLVLFSTGNILKWILSLLMLSIVPAGLFLAYVSAGKEQESVCNTQGDENE